MRKITIEYVRAWVKDTECELLSTEYINAKNKLEFKCRCGKVFQRTWDSARIAKKFLCVTCLKKEITPRGVFFFDREQRFKSIKEVKRIVENEMGCKYLTRYTVKNTRSTIIEFECPKHGLQRVYWTNLEKRRICPSCNEHNKQNSKLTKKVKKFLDINNINYEKEYKFLGCKNKRELPFDFYISTLNLCIEVHGRQHYEKSYFGGWNDSVAEEKLKATKHHDSIKEKFCIDNNIKLIIIPFFTDDKEKTYLKILNKVILGEVNK